ncbi:MAG: MMPL family transporter, partial [Nocardioides sp.]|nr:MMPL family transporter [Nocardioides sp.]
PVDEVMERIANRDHHGGAATGRRLVDEERHGLAHRWATMVVAQPWAVVSVVVVLLALLAWPVSQMRLGMPSGDTAGLETSERQAYDAITWTFGEGWNGPLVVVAHPEGAATFDEAALTAVGDRLAEHPDVVDVRMMGATDDKTTAVWSVVPSDGPLDASTADLVHDLRAADFADGLGADLGVTGLTAINLDISERLADVLPLYIGIIVLISLAILTLVFRSVVIPVKATAGFLLSILATFGLTTLVFQWGTFKEAVGVDTAGPLLSFLPIMVTGILYGLAMDYEVFLVSSMRQAHVHGHPGKEAIVHGFEQASRVVVAAAVIMVSVFAAFVLTDDTTIKQFGFALSTGVLLDAFLVRMTLGPALMAIMGRHSWSLPRWMARFLPDLDIEGDRLVRRMGSPKG